MTTYHVEALYNDNKDGITAPFDVKRRNVNSSSKVVIVIRDYAVSPRKST